MKAQLYKMDCLTNLHMGAGGGNYSIIDNEVEKDCNGYPIMHASGIKGALRETVSDENHKKDIFGSPAEDGVNMNNSKGKYVFMDGCILSRTMRVCGNTSYANLPVSTPEMIRHFVQLTSAFGCCPVDASLLPADEAAWGFGENNFLCNVENARVEDDPTGQLPCSEDQMSILKLLLGEHFAIAKQLGDEYPLPSVARNCVDIRKTNNFWYEEFVPYGSRFYTIILTPDDGMDLDFSKPVQFGANASIGRGFVKVEQWRRDV